MLIRFLVSLLRVTAVTAMVTAALWSVCALPVRQPVLFRAPLRTELRSSPAELRRHVTHLAVTLMPRNADSPSNLDAAAAYIRGRVRAGRLPRLRADTARTAATTGT
jgi:hypothetical protein